MHSFELPVLPPLYAGIGVGLLVFTSLVAALAVLVLFHELGHLLIARLFGFQISTVSVGFGPKLLGLGDRHGTVWQVAALPIGGFVMYDDDVPNVRADINAGKSASIRGMAVRRAAVAAGGPIANILLAILIFTGAFALGEREPFVDRFSTCQASHRPIEQPLLGALVCGAKETYITTEWLLTNTRNFVIGEPLAPNGGDTGNPSMAFFLAHIVGSLSVVLALLNLLPLLPFDGGRLISSALEAGWGLAIPERAQQVASRVGFSLATILPVLAVGLTWIR
jgi:membrane-associated protease RseP (regulator of RpoE activity)